MRLVELGHQQVPARLANLILRLSATEGIMSREGIRIPTPCTHRQLGTMSPGQQGSGNQSHDRAAGSGGCGGGGPLHPSDGPRSLGKREAEALACGAKPAYIRRA